MKPKRPPIVLARDLNKSLVEDIKRRGLWRCGVLMPNCEDEPYAEVLRTGGVKGLRSLFCLKHARMYALKIGHVLEEPEAHN